MTPLMLSAGCRLLTGEAGNPIFSVLISVSRPDGSFVTDLRENSFDFGYFPTGDAPFGVGLEGLVTNAFQNYANVPDQVAPGFYGLTLSFSGPQTAYVPLLFVTVTERALIADGVGPGGRGGKSHVVAQGQLVIGKSEDHNFFA